MIVIIGLIGMTYGLFSVVIILWFLGVSMKTKVSISRRFSKRKPQFLREKQLYLDNALSRASKRKPQFLKEKYHDHGSFV